MINAASSDTFAFDCVCLIKALLWGWDGSLNTTNGGAVYKSNGVPDIGTEQIINVCTDVSTDFSNIKVGELLWMSGHVGIYIGDGLAVECTPAWKNCVQITCVRNINQSGNGHTWTKHGKLPYVEYCSDHTKSDEYGYCPNCGEKFSWTLDTTAAGIYTVIDPFTPRVEPYDKTDWMDRKFSLGSKVTVTGALINGRGNRWYEIKWGNNQTGYVYENQIQYSCGPITVKYNANGGSGAPGNQTKVYGSTLTLSSTKPTRAGYTFLGWSTSSTATSATYAAGGSYTSNASATLYAVWQKHTCNKGTYKYYWKAHPHYNCYECSLCGEITEARDEVNYVSSCETCNPPAPTYTITLNPSNGSCSVSTITVTEGVAIGTLPVPTRSGYIFEGWYTSGGTQITSSSTFTGNTTIYAVWNTDYVNIGEDFYAYLSNKSSGLGVSNINGNVQLGTAKVAASTWRFVRQSDGSYKILSALDNRAMDVYNNETEDFTNVWVYGENDTLAQRWFIRSVNGGYLLISANSGKALDVDDGNLTSGTNLQIYTINNTAAQIMSITKTPDPTISSSATSITLDVGESTTIWITKNGYYAEDWTFGSLPSNYNVGTACVSVIHKGKNSPQPKQNTAKNRGKKNILSNRRKARKKLYRNRHIQNCNDRIYHKSFT